MERSQDLREQAIAARQKGMSRAQVCEVFGIHRTTLRRWEVLLAQAGALAPRPRRGRAPKLAPEHNTALLAQLRAHPDATLEEHARRWHQQTGQSLSRSTMARSILRLGHTRKKRA